MLDGKLGELLQIAVTVKDLPYGSAYRTIRYCLLMESACEILGFRLGYRREIPISIGGQDITQADVIEYLGLGKGRTFWNCRSVHHLAMRARDELALMSYESRQGHQTKTLNIAKHMLDPSLLALPCEAGSASTASSMSKPDFEGRCNQALRMQPQGQ